MDNETKKVLNFELGTKVYSKRLGKGKVKSKFKNCFVVNFEEIRDPNFGGHNWLFNESGKMIAWEHDDTLDVEIMNEY